MVALIATIAAIAVAGALAHSARRRFWLAAEQDLRRRFTLGSDGVICGAQSIYHGGHGRAVLLLHGFGDTPQSLGDLAERLADAGWSVSVPLLPGHGRTLAEFNGSGADSWMAAAESEFDALSQHHDPVIVCGQSMGAALAIGLTSRRSVRSVALLAPYISMPGPARWVAAALVWPVAQVAAPVVQTRDPRSVRDREAGERSLAYGYVTPRLLAELWKVVRRARRDVAGVPARTLIVHSREDNRVPARDVLALSARLPRGAEVHWVSGCGHVITVDYCKEQVAALLIDWLERSTARHNSVTPAR